MPFTNPENMIACHQWCTESVVAEHHPSEPGMKYVIRVLGGKHSGVEIHCPTEASTLKLFDEIVAYRMRYSDHPFLAAV